MAQYVVFKLMPSTLHVVALQIFATEPFVQQDPLKAPMPLTVIQIKSAKPKVKPYNMADEKGKVEEQ